MSEVRYFDVEYDISPDESKTPKQVDICAICANGKHGSCVMIDFCANARRLTLGLLESDIKGQDTPPRHYNGDWQSGYQMANLMALNAVCDRRSGKLEEVLERAERAAGE
jgi:hypothetical protein